MLLIVYGTRPEWIKIKPVLDNLEIPYKLLSTGQHEDIAPSQDLSLKIKDGPNRLDSIVQSIMNQEDIFKNITHIMVQGDTTSAFAFALAAFHRGIKIIHLEAGLRTYNKKHPYPEEFNRKSISAMADVHLCPTEKNAQNLRDEGVEKGVYITGNTVLDNLAGMITSTGDTVLVTLHRRENHPIMHKWFSALNDVAKELTHLQFLLPLHPNPAVQKHKHLLTHVNTCPPLHYEDFLPVLANCRFVISDSGGIQEEAAFLNKRVIVCREYTERPEGLVGHHMICKKPEDLILISRLFDTNHRVHVDCPFGNGTAGMHVAHIIGKVINGRN